MNKTFNVSLGIDPVIKLAFYRAIVHYCHDCHVDTTDLNKLVETSDMTDDKVLALKQEIEMTDKISKERKDNIINLITLISEINDSAALLFLQIIMYLNTLRTGWWIFTTGNSRLKQYFNAALEQFDAMEHDTRLINHLKAQKSFSCVPPDVETAIQLGKTEERIKYLESFVNSYQEKIRQLEEIIENKDEKIIALLNDNRRILENNLTIEDADRLHMTFTQELSSFPQEDSVHSGNNSHNGMIKTSSRNCF